ncbi:D-galactarolactone cycloisomerase [Ancylobacter aquaticus]|uniref:D-galactarolactone cycloisomerase n=1 Tax=Ancylobacter aquaticus TaxID=100 RepID=A0A4R1ICL6_ANCAQ|nr:mandelate racemase/muconate lactonizing enzyme family protein [Ancylobacter aquaticus]TCK28332.1 D-galactarolactone cycloisomerase [Ancylobacter aquaticus]
MRIAALHTHILEAELTQPFGWSFDSARSRGACIVEIVTDTGLIGWGECYGPARMNAAVIEGFRRHLLGADPMAGEVLWQVLHSRFRDYGQRGLVISALSGVDIALWDLRGKALGVPVHRLMGGPLRTRVQAYATGTYRLEQGDPLDYVVREVRGYVDEGFQAVKLKIGLDLEEDIALIRATRAAIGPEREMMLDANHGFDALDAIALGRCVADQNISWFEEPVIPEDLASYREVKAGQPIPVAGGECTATRWGFLDILTTRAMDIIQPDTAAAGGLTECKKIADMAAAFGIRYIPHVWGTGIGLAAALQLLAVLPHTPPRHTPREPLLEFDRSEHPFRQAVLAEPIEHVRGWVDIPTRPGLGVEIDRAALRRFSAA